MIFITTYQRGDYKKNYPTLHLLMVDIQKHVRNYIKYVANRLREMRSIAAGFPPSKFKFKNSNSNQNGPRCAAHTTYKYQCRRKYKKKIKFKFKNSNSNQRPTVCRGSQIPTRHTSINVATNTNTTKYINYAWERTPQNQISLGTYPS